MNDEPLRRRTSGSGRHAAPARERPALQTRTARAARRAARPSHLPTRLTQGALVVALAAAVGGFAVQTAATADPRVRKAEAARVAVTGAAVDAIDVALEARDAGQDATVDAERLAELDAATAELQELLGEAGASAGSSDASAQPGTGTSDEPSDEPSGEPSAEPSDEPSDDATAAASVDGLLSASGAPDLTASSGVVAPEPDPTSEPTSQPTNEPTSEPTNDPTNEPIGEPTSEPTSEPTDQPEPTDEPTDTADDALEAADAVVVPPVTGPEDATTTRLRAALARVVELSDAVLDTAEQAREEEAAEQAAQREAEEQAAQQEAEERAAQEAADEAAAEAAAQEAAERAAWKRSLLGYANGQIPSEALCAPSFDATALLRCDAAQDLDALDAAYHDEFGVHLTITDSYRSYAGQVSCRARKGWLCAVPGTSNHGTGVAVDLGGGVQTFGTREWTWLAQNAATYGWAHPDWAEPGGSKPEPWHWEYTL